MLAVEPVVHHVLDDPLLRLGHTLVFGVPDLLSSAWSSGPGPVQDVDRFEVPLPPDTPVPFDEVFDGGPGQVREHVPQGRHAHAGAEFVEVVDHLVAFLAVGGVDRPAEGLRVQGVLNEVGVPIAEGAFSESEESGDAVPGPTAFEELLPHFDRVASGGIFPFPFEALAGEAAWRRPLAGRRMGDSGVERLHGLGARRGRGGGLVFFCRVVAGVGQCSGEFGPHQQHAVFGFQLGDAGAELRDLLLGGVMSAGRSPGGAVFQGVGRRRELRRVPAPG